MDRLAPEGLFAFCAIVHFILALYTLYRMTRRQAPLRAERENFQGLPVPKTATPESAILDPRAPAEEPFADERQAAPKRPPPPR